MFKKLRRHLFFIPLVPLAFAGVSVSAQTEMPIFDTLRVTVRFSGGSSYLDFDYKDNGASFFKFMETVNVLNGESPTKVHAVKCFAGTTFDDFMKGERVICGARNATIKHVLDRYLTVKPEKIKMISVGLNWREALVYAQEKDIPFRKEVERIIKFSPEKIFEGDTLTASSIFELMELNRGTVWEQLRKGCFEDMNSVELLCIFERNFPAVMQARPPEFSDFYPADEIFSGKKTNFSMSVRTNLLSDVALIPSIGLDFYVGHNFSIAGQWGYSYWTLSDKNLIWKYYGGDIAVRWWFSKNKIVHPLTGHHVGPYGQMAAFDFATGTNRFSGPRWSWAAGIEYGYSIPFKGKRVSIDFTIGIGYASGDLDTWFLKTNAAGEDYYEWRALNKIQYIGPTKAEISLIWLLGGWTGKK